MTANDLKPGMELAGATITKVARRGADVTVTLEGGDTVELSRWEEITDAEVTDPEPDAATDEDAGAGEPEDAGMGGTDVGWSARTSDGDED